MTEPVQHPEVTAGDDESRHVPGTQAESERAESQRESEQTTDRWLGDHRLPGSSVLETQELMEEFYAPMTGTATVKNQRP